MKYDLKDYLVWWLAEATSESPDFEVTAYGLCCNVKWNCSISAQIEFNEILQNSYNGYMYPFGGKWVYDLEREQNKIHLNPDRLNFVRKILEN